MTRGITWKSVVFSSKDVIYIIAFVFSMSGIYYKLFFQEDMRTVQMQAVKDEQLKIQGDVNQLKLDVRHLQDADLRRTTIEQQQGKKSQP